MFKTLCAMKRTDYKAIRRQRVSWSLVVESLALYTHFATQHHKAYEQRDASTRSLHYLLPSAPSLAIT